MMPAAPAQSNLQLSRLASVRNGEIPVILVYVKDKMPQNYKLVPPEEAQDLLATIEYLRDYLQQTLAVQEKKEKVPEGETAHEQK